MLGCVRWSDDIHRAFDGGIVETKSNHFHRIVSRNPRKSLLSVAKWATEAKSKRSQHRAKCAAMFGEDHAKSKVHHADACIARAATRIFPLLHNISEKSKPRTTCFVHDSRCCAVVAHGTRREKQARWTRTLVLRSRHRLCNEARPSHSTLENLALACGTPSLICNPCTCEMDDSVDALKL